MDFFDSTDREVFIIILFYNAQRLLFLSKISIEFISLTNQNTLKAVSNSSIKFVPEAAILLLALGPYIVYK